MIIYAIFSLALYDWPGFDFLISPAHDIMHGEIIGNLSTILLATIRSVGDGGTGVIVSEAWAHIDKECKDVAKVNNLEFPDVKTEAAFVYEFLVAWMSFN